MTDVYLPQTWANGVLGGTPINAERLQHMENGIVRSAPSQGNIYAPLPTGDPDVDTPNLQTSVDACIVGGDISTVRLATKKLVLGPGSYVVNEPIAIQSVIGFDMEGAGRDITRIKGTGTIDAVLSIDGCTDGRFGNFSVNGSGTHFIDKAISLQWSGSPPIGRSTSNVELHHILVNECTYRTGFAIGTESANLQVDHTVIRDCIAFGSRTPGSGITTHSQYGFELGSGVSGNVLGTTMINSSSALNKYGVYWNATNGYVFGTQPSSNEVDFHVVGASGPVMIFGGRSESAQRLYEGVGTSGASTVAIQNFLWVGNAIASDGKWITNYKSGVVLLDNVTQTGITNAGTTSPLPIMEFADTSLGASPMSVTLNNVQQQAPITTGLSLGADNAASIEITNYSQLAAADGASVVKTTNRRSLRGNALRHSGPDYLSTLGNNPIFANAMGNNIQTFIAANNALLVQVRPDRDIALTTLEWYSGNVSSGNYDIGIYNDIGHALYRKGSTAWPVANDAPFATVSLTLQAGRIYYIAFAGDNTTGEFRGSSSFAFSGPQKTMDGTYLTHVVASSFPLPLDISVGNTFGQKAPLITLRETY